MGLIISLCLIRILGVDNSQEGDWIGRNRSPRSLRRFAGRGWAQDAAGGTAKVGQHPKFYAWFVCAVGGRILRCKTWCSSDEGSSDELPGPSSIACGI